ncbi:MAG: hypothetical protein H7145_24460 [Akkermansiaceae bacterium]|nr:hypothetical protein [Armatimonadota bacterium]
MGSRLLIAKPTVPFDCTVCRKPLRETVVPKPGDKDFRAGYPTTAYHGNVCCRTAHCPFCGASHEERCPHLLARKTADSGWTIPGMRIKNHEPGVNVWNATEPKHLLQPSITLLQRVFGDQFSFVEKYYGTGLTEEPNGGEMLADLLTLHNRDDEQSFRRRRGGWQHVVFSRDAETSRDAIRGMIATLRKQFARFYKEFQPVTAPSAFLIRTGKKGWYRQYRLRFTTDGRHLILFDGTHVTIVQVPDGNVRGSISHISGSWGSIGRIYVSEIGEILRYGYRNFTEKSKNYFIVTRNLTTGAEERTLGDASTLAGEDILLAPDDRIRLEDEAGPLKVRLTEKCQRMQVVRRGDDTFATSLDFRAPVTDYAISPMGNAMATVIADHIVVWKL